MGPLLRVAAAVVVLEDGREGPSRGHGAARWVAAAPKRPVVWHICTRAPHEFCLLIRSCRIDTSINAGFSAQS